VGNRITDGELIDEIQRLARKLGTSPTAIEMREHGRYSYSTYRQRFGGWNEALQRAGLPKNQNGPDRELLGEIRELTTELGHVPRQREMRNVGSYSVTTYQERFGSWTAAREAAGLPGSYVDPDNGVSDWELLQDVQGVVEQLDGLPTRADIDNLGEFQGSTIVKRFGGLHTALRILGLDPDWERKRIPDLPLLIELRTLADQLGRTPTVEDLNTHGSFSEQPYARTFGSFSAAVREAGLDPTYRQRGDGVSQVECDQCEVMFSRPTSQIEPTGNVFCSKECFYEFKSEHYSGENHWAWAGHDAGYGPHWQQTREDVLARDNYGCQECGMTDTEHREQYDASLSIHHIEPRSTFDDLEEADVLDNLVALCKPCHLKIESNRRGEN
jgi:hypothetical protein